MPLRRCDGMPLLALATLVLGYALQINNGFYTPVALGMLLLAIVLAALAFERMGASGAPEPVVPAARSLEPGAGSDASRTLASASEPAPERLLVGIMLAGLAVNLIVSSLMPPGLYLVERQPSAHPIFLAGLAAAAIVIIAMVRDRRRAGTVWFPLLLVIAAGLGIWMIEASPRPQIDVLAVHKMAISGLRSGHNPYAINFPNIYRDTEFYARDAVQGRFVTFGLPYPPLSLFMAIPGQVLFHDIRYAELIALIAGAALLGYAPRRGRATASLGAIVGPLAAALLLFTPRSLFVLEQGWTESLAIVWLGASIFAACRAPRLLPWMLALLVSVKQHMVLALPLALLTLPRPIDARAMVRLLWPSFAVPLALALPFLIWNAPAFLDSVVWLQLKEPFRADSLSILSALAAGGMVLERDSVLTLALPLAMLAAAFAMAWRLAPRTPAGFAASLGLVLLLLFAGSKKAFCNYYYFVIAAFCGALAASAAPSPPPVASSAPGAPSASPRRAA